MDMRKHRARVRKALSGQQRVELPTTKYTNSHLNFASNVSLTSAFEVARQSRLQFDAGGMSVTQEQVDDLLISLGKDISIDSVLEPVFLSLLDGTMRACRIGTRQGITASRLYVECKNFAYDADFSNFTLDSYNESIIERDNTARFDKRSTYSDGVLSQDGNKTKMRDGNKMNTAKSNHFGDDFTAVDEYDPSSTIYSNQAHAKSLGRVDKAAETDHIVSCAEICNDLKSNKGLTPQDIKEIVNSEDNFAVTSMHNNRGTGTGKFAKTAQELRKEVEQGYAVRIKKNKKEVRVPLSEDDIRAREIMIAKMESSRESIDKRTNAKVVENILKKREVQGRLAKDAGMSAMHQSIGDLLMFLIKPLYFELNDCLRNGVLDGVSTESFKAALKVRINRMKNYVLAKAKTTLGEGVYGFFKNFVFMLLEGIVNCFVGVYKHVIRVVKEGTKMMFQIVPILRNRKLSASEKGNAIIKLIAGSMTILAGIGLESWLNSIGLDEPWSIILSSVLSAVLTTLVMFMLDKMDLFGVNKKHKVERITEILTLRVEADKNEIQGLLNQLA